uniref:Serine-threonine/tyrosine-protein kinase catalytic domain-containing protein n=1 Tax=Rhizophagus irregularis (strain DAOM 181602 / DAOM 197198 / MUCL 43194) TaxID=747089 RepID=U9USA3_RHIID
MWEISRGKPPDNSNIIFPIINIHKATVFGTPKEYENLYRNCWNQEPKQRPTINEILDEFKKMGFVNDVTSKLVKGMMFWLRHDLDVLGCIPLYS